jgi:3-oxoacyl-[acyl-carrier-protein] synthase III
LTFTPRPKPHKSIKSIKSINHFNFTGDNPCPKSPHHRHRAYIPRDEHRTRIAATLRQGSHRQIRRRHRYFDPIYAPNDWATSDLAVAACKSALAEARLQPEDIDLLVLGTDTPDFMTPATSVVVQHKLGLKKAGTFDVGCACASFPTGLAIASGIMATQPQIKRALVVGVYLMHRLADLEKDR